MRTSANRADAECLQRPPDHAGRVAGVIAALSADVVVLSYNNEAWLTFDELHRCVRHGDTWRSSPSIRPRYVGAKIGIHDPNGRKVGAVSHVRNTEYVVVAGDRPRVRSMVAAVESAGLGVVVDASVPARCHAG